jgi:hypothetical protein
MNATTTTDTAQDPRLVRYLTTCHVYTHGEMRTGTCGKPAASIGATTSNRGTHDAPVPVVEYEPTCKFHVSVANRRNRRYGWSQPNHAWLALDDATAVEALTHEWRERTAADERRKADEREANKKRWIASRDRAIAESKVRYLTLDRPDYEVDYEKADRLTREGYDRDDARQEARIAKPRWLVVDGGGWAWPGRPRPPRPPPRRGRRPTATRTTSRGRRRTRSNWSSLTSSRRRSGCERRAR